MPKGYDPLKLTETTEQIVVDGNKRKYARLARPLRFYGGITSATEVGCNLRCKFCFSDKPVRNPQSTGKFYTPDEVFNALKKNADKHGHKLISASASEGTLGQEHLFELLELVDRSEFVFVLETNGITIGSDPNFAKQLSKYKNVHVRVSVKGTSKEEYSMLTGAALESYDLQYKAFENLINEKVSCNACLMVSFSEEKEIQKAEKRLADIHPGLLKSLEKEHITLFPKVLQRLSKYGILPNTVQRSGKIIRLKKEKNNV